MFPSLRKLRISGIALRGREDTYGLKVTATIKGSDRGSDRNYHFRNVVSSWVRASSIPSLR